jgi:release factor glutamine methyltransferase
MKDANIREPATRGGEIGRVALALWAQQESRRLGDELQAAGIRALLLKGPDLQQRLYGTPAAYASGDVDILVRRDRAKAACDHLERRGWTFAPENGLLWRVSRAAAFDRDGFTVDLHWGLHAAHLPSWSLEPLGRRLWQGAREGSSGMLEPDPESLLVFLAVHAVGHRFERPEWTENVRRAATLVTDWAEVWRIAHAARVTNAVKAALAADGSPTSIAILDGVWGSLVSGSTWLTRGHFVPASVRDRVRSAAALGREGFGYLGRRRRILMAGDVELSVPIGVVRPRVALSEELAAVGGEMIRDVRSPVVVDVGAGAGAVAVLIGRARSDASVHATDISSRAVAAARANTKRSRLANVDVHLGDLLDPLPSQLRGRVDAIVTNLPADPPSTARSRGSRDPNAALVGHDSDGMGLLRALASQSRAFLRPGGRLVVTLLGWQWDVLRDELSSTGYVPLPVHPSTATAYRYAVAERR